MKSLFPLHLQLSSKVLDMQLERQNLVMSNLANIKTPGYKALDMEWEEQLQAALGRDARGKMTRTEQGHMPAVFSPESFGPEWHKAFRPHVIMGDDSVDMDKEMAKMSKNVLMYKSLSTVIQKNFEGLNKIISEGGR